LDATVAESARVRSTASQVVENTVGGGRTRSDVDVLVPSDSRASDQARTSVIAQRARPATAQNSYVIVFKPTATLPQIDDLVARYRLRVTKSIPQLLLLRVERLDGATAGTSVAAPAKGREGLERLLNPQIVQDLRREPIVESAFVESTMSTKSVPKAKGTTVTSGGVTFNWHWNDGLGGAATPSPAPSSPTPQQDGNWGLKVMRLPPVWSIIERNRKANPKLAKPKLAILDTGFFPHEDLKFNALRSPDGRTAPVVPVVASLKANLCELAHGNHVAGIAGAVWGTKAGIDGVIPQAKIDGVPFNIQGGVDTEGLDESTAEVTARMGMFGDVIWDLVAYLEDSAKNPENLRVVNMSLGYNFVADKIVDDPEASPALKSQIQTEAKIFARLMKQYEDNVLFVIAAGNDSSGQAKPINAKWASAAAWAATQTSGDARPKNVLVVEAIGRDGLRAEFSNVAGHVSAPGVNILSTLSTGDNTYGVCSGTSQAAPHVAALATLLYELDPGKKPSEIADIIKSSAIKQASGSGAPRVDALEAVLKLDPKNLTRLADLNDDGKVDVRDVEIFAKHMSQISQHRTKGTPFTEDLNGDGVVDGNECSWPLIDLNGSGTASLATADARPIRGTMMTDIQVMELAWTDRKNSFKEALKQTGLDAAIKAANDPASVASIPTGKCK
jgi:hypothetical protein